MTTTIICQRKIIERNHKEKQVFEKPFRAGVLKPQLVSSKGACLKCRFQVLTAEIPAQKVRNLGVCIFNKYKVRGSKSLSIIALLFTCSPDIIFSNTHFYSWGTSLNGKLWPVQVQSAWSSRSLLNDKKRFPQNPQMPPPSVTGALNCVGATEPSLKIHRKLMN